MRAPTLQLAFDTFGELIVDLFAGGGGASTGIEQALGVSPDIAVNHDPEALALHQANHPSTLHLAADVREVNPRKVTKGRPVGLLWLSPDCKHFSKAKGGKPRNKHIRSLAWVAIHWAAAARPRCIVLENVEEFKSWGPLMADDQPCPKRKGETFDRWVGRLRALGYKVEWKELRACDYGAPTIRKRFFLIARCDGRPIVWPQATHAKPDAPEVKRGKLKAWRTAAECIDFSLPCPSIFLSQAEARRLGVKRPLAAATMRRIAKGVFRYVINATRPFIVPVTHPGDARVHSIDEPMRTITGAHRGEHALVAPVLTEHANASRQAVWSADEPLRTQCAEVKGGHFALIAPTIERQFGASTGNAADAPLGTITAAGGGKAGLVSAFLTKYHAGSIGSPAGEPFPTITSNGDSDRPGGNPPLAVIAAHLDQANGGFYEGGGRAIDEPAGTVCAQGSMQRLVATSLVKLRGTSSAASSAEPMHTVSAQGQHHAEVRAFLVKSYSQGGQHAACDEPMHTITTKDRMGLVTVDGTDYAIADIGLRMLTPRELFLANGFPADYIIDILVPNKKGKLRPLPKDAQVRMCGNGVPPAFAKAIVAANVGEIRHAREVAVA